MKYNNIFLVTPISNKPFLLEYICPGGNETKRSQSSLKAFISEENQTDPETKKL